MHPSIHSFIYLFIYPSIPHLVTAELLREVVIPPSGSKYVPRFTTRLHYRRTWDDDDDDGGDDCDDDDSDDGDDDGGGDDDGDDGWRWWWR